MTDRNQSFHGELRVWLKKTSCFTPREIEALVTILGMLIGSPVFSLNQVAKRAPQKFGRNFLTKCLMKYAYVQREIARRAFTDMSSQLKQRGKKLVVLDDTLVKKCGKKIRGSFKWYDHTIRRQVQGFCIVNVAVVVDAHLLFIIPWILWKQGKPNRQRISANKEQDAKTLAAIEMIQTIIGWFVEIEVPEKHLVVIADAWYGNKTMQAFIKQTGSDCRIDCRKNYSVQVPNPSAIKARGQQKRGRKRTKFVSYKPLEQYMGNSSLWDYFTDPKTQERVSYKIATVTLKAAGRVTIYAFKWVNQSSPKFIMVRAFRKSRPTPQTVYFQYKLRWRIEEAHRDLKQQFGLRKCQARDGWVVQGFIGLVYLGYSLWKRLSFLASQLATIPLKCPSWAQAFHQGQIVAEMLAGG